MAPEESFIDHAVSGADETAQECISDKVYRIDSGHDFLEWREGAWTHMYWDPDLARAYPESFDSNCRNMLIDHFKLDPMDPHLSGIEFIPPDTLKYRAEQMDKGD